MKAEAKMTLIKDIALAVIAWIIAAFAFSAMMPNQGFLICLVPGFWCAGVPFGWRWLSNIITAIGIIGVLIKFFGALILGWLALPVTIVKDIIAYVNAN